MVNELCREHVSGKKHAWSIQGSDAWGTPGHFRRCMVPLQTFVPICSTSRIIPPKRPKGREGENRFPEVLHQPFNIIDL